MFVTNTGHFFAAVLSEMGKIRTHIVGKGYCLMINTLQNTPLWVYAVFLLLCYLGIKALFPTRESKISLMLTPPILLVWSLYSLDLTDHPLLTLGYWVTAVIVASVAAQVIFSRQGVVLDERGSGLILRGTAKTLALYLLFFFHQLLLCLSGRSASAILGDAADGFAQGVCIRLCQRPVLWTGDQVLSGVPIPQGRAFVGAGLPAPTPQGFCPSARWTVTMPSRSNRLVGLKRPPCFLASIQV